MGTTQGGGSALNFIYQGCSGASYTGIIRFNNTGYILHITMVYDLDRV